MNKHRFCGMGEVPVNLVFILKKSLLLPKKEALFQLNRVNMKDTLFYMVCLMILLFFPEVIKMIMNGDQVSEGSSYSTYIIQILVLYSLLILFMAVTGISILAFFSLIIAKLVKRKLAYHYLWKITVYAATYPVLIYMVLKLFQIDYVVVNQFPLIVLFLLIYKIILFYPKRSS